MYTHIVFNMKNFLINLSRKENNYISMKVTGGSSLLSRDIRYIRLSRLLIILCRRKVFGRGRLRERIRSGLIRSISRFKVWKSSFKIKWTRSAQLKEEARKQRTSSKRNKTYNKPQKAQ